VISFFFLSALWRGDAARFLTSMDLDLDLDGLDLLVVVICLRTAGTAEATILLIGACAGACDFNMYYSARCDSPGSSRGRLV
jgi:hypothetical protein